MAREVRPTFKGTTIHRDADLVFEFHYNDEWTRYEMPDHPGGVLVSPQKDVPRTWLSVWKKRLEEKITHDDVDDVRAGLDEGLAQLEGFSLISSDEELYARWIRFERIYTYREGEQVRKCKQWVVYINHWMVVLTFRAENEEEYAYYLAMVNYSFHTLRWN